MLTSVEPVQMDEDPYSARGAYGSVTPVRLNGGVKCAEKRVHNALLTAPGSNEAEKFCKECMFLSQMRHPNIVQFLGVRQASDNSLSLVMEFLPMSLHDCVLRCKNNLTIPLHLKLSILQDVVYGLLHLHELNIIHRDLSPKNILLTSSLRAKIADLGVSRALTAEELRGRATLRLTDNPGAQYVMPPEVMKKDCQYTNKMDIFSFGIVALFLVLQEFPRECNDGITVERTKNKEIEVGKRIEPIKTVSKDYDIQLGSLIRECLQDVPDRRPSTRELKDKIEQLCLRHHDQIGDTIQMLQTINKLVG